MRRRLSCFITLVLLVFAVPLLGQGTTGTLTGTASTEGNPLPGVTVTISSPSLQGTRTTVTGESGAYSFAALPPGRYTVEFTLDGMSPVQRIVSVNLAQSTRADAELAVAAMTEAIVVLAAAPAALETSEVSTNFGSDTIQELPVQRDITNVTLLAPGVNDAGPNDQIIISGAQSFDNLFLVNGVVVNENLRGQPEDLFIEDAIQETTVLTAGVSAEFGRFTGGVVSTLTKSGGNEFSGSIRDSLTNDDWTDKTDFASQVDPVDSINDVFEATLGGRIIRDRLWFFAAGRLEERDTSAQTFNTNIPYVETREDRRIEAKLTGQITPRNSLVGSYMDSLLERTNIRSGNIVDLRSLTNREDPKELLALNYSGVFTNSFLVEGQYSRMDHAFFQGAETRDLIDGTILLESQGPARRGWSPTFCGQICGEKERDNESWLLKGTYFLSTASMGSHNIVGGFEEFHQLRNENNFQSGSDLRIHGNFFYNGSDIGFGVDTDSEIEYDPVPALSQTSDFAVRSFFVNDRWDLSPRLNFNVGLRYDEAFGTDQAGNKTVDDDAFSPRLGATYDLRGDGRQRFSATYGRYVSKVDQGPADNTATAGRYASYYFDYRGPAINPRGTPFDQLIPIPDVIRMVFEWFNSVGGVSNTEFLTSARVPGVTTQFEKSLEAPYMDEYTVGFGTMIGTAGYIRADYINRAWDKFYVIRRTTETGTAVDPNGLVVDIGLIENSQGNLERDYQGIQLQGSYRLLSRLSLGGNYTWSELRGNVEGEAASFATTFTDEFNYPEYTNFERNNPVGYLDADIRHRANLWLQYDLPTAFGEFNLSLLQRYQSGLPYSVLAAISTAPASVTGIQNPGYQRPPVSANYYFSDRNELRLDDITRTDLGVNYLLPLRRVKLFIQADLINMFNEQGIEDPSFINTSVLTNRSASCIQQAGAPSPGSRCAAFNPFTETPVEGTHFVRNAAFGQPISADAYQLPRTYRVSAGIRF